jgi:hypothetical protein
MKVIIKIVKGSDQPHRRRLEVEFIKVGDMPNDTIIGHFNLHPYKGHVKQRGSSERKGNRRLWKNVIYIPKREECPMTTMSFEMNKNEVKAYAEWLVDNLKKHEKNNK